jgi:hypothetical protein
MQIISHQDEITKMLNTAVSSIMETPSDLISFRTLVGYIRDIVWKEEDNEIYFMSFIFDNLFVEIMRHVTGHASLFVNRDDAIALVKATGSNLKLIVKALEEGDLNMLHNSYITMVSDYIERIKKLRVENK